MATISYTVSDFVNKVSSNHNSYIYSYSKRVREADTDVQDFQEVTDTFRKQVRKLKNYDDDHFDRDKIEKQLTSFVESYNDMKDSVSAKDNSEIAAQLAKIDDIINDNSSKLKTLGIKLSDDELKFDTDTFEDVTDKEAEKICGELFSGSDSFISKIYKAGRTLEKTADSEEYHMNLRQLHTTTTYSYSQLEAAMNAARIKSLLAECETAQDEDDQKAAVKEYAEGYQWLRAAIHDETIAGKLKDLQTDNADNLEKVGISLDEETKMSYDESISPDEDAYATLFSKDSAYTSSMYDMCNQIIQENLKTEKLGVTLDLSV